MEAGHNNSEAGRPRVWALLGARAGDNAQVLALAHALGWPFEVKQLEYNRLRMLGPRLLGHSLASLTAGSRTLMSGDPPDLTISVGHRSVPVVQWLHRRSDGRTRSVHIGFPRIDPSNFNLVLTTPQYPVPDRANVLRLPFALAGAASEVPNVRDEAALAGLPEPRRLLVVGGPNLYWEIDRPALIEMLAAMLVEAEESGGSVLVTTSPRTPRRLTDEIAKAVDRAGVPTLLAEPGRSPAYTSLLSAADSIHVTADSVAMVSDAIWTGKPIALVPVIRKPLGTIVIGLLDRLRPGRPAYPQDLRFFWRAIAALGVSERLARPRLSGQRQRDEIVRRVRAIVLQHSEQEGKNGGRGKD